MEQLSRLVRNNAAGVTGAALGASIGGDNVLLGPLEDIRNYSKKTADAVTG